MNKIRAIVAGGALASAGALVAIPSAFADDHPVSVHHLLPAPVVTESPASFTVTLAGVGQLAFTVDPTTLAISALTATPVVGGTFVAGAPLATPGFVADLFTSPSGVSRLLIARITEVHGSVLVTTSNDRGLFRRMQRADRDDNDGLGENHMGSGNSGNTGSVLPAPSTSAAAAPPVVGRASASGEGNGSGGPGSSNSGSNRSGDRSNNSGSNGSGTSRSGGDGSGNSGSGGH